MAKIVNVNYEAIPTIARQIRTYAQELNRELLEAYKGLEEMHKSWYGKRYNSLVKEFNTIVSKVNEMNRLVVGKIPFILENIANNYAKADKGMSVIGATKTEPHKIKSLTVPTDVGMKFMSDEVEAIRTKILANFHNAIEKIKVIEATLKKIEWQSKAAEAFKATFAKLKAEIIKALEHIESQFEKLITQAMEDIKATENANTVYGGNNRANVENTKPSWIGVGVGKNGERPRRW